MSLVRLVYSLPDVVILGCTKLKAFTDGKLEEAYIRMSVVDRIENIAGKEENAGYQHFLLFPQCFHKSFMSIDR